MTKIKTKRQLFEFLDSLVEDEEIDEISTSAGAGAFSTPNAFSSDKDSDGSQSLAKHAHDDAMVFNKEPNKSKKNTVKEGTPGRNYDAIAKVIVDLVNYYPHPSTHAGQQIEIISKLLPIKSGLNSASRTKLKTAIQQLEVETDCKNLTPILTKLRMTEVTVKEGSIRVFSIARPYVKSDATELKKKASQFIKRLQSDRFTVSQRSVLYFPEFKRYGPCFGALIGSDTIVIGPLGSDNIYKFGEGLLARVMSDGDLTGYSLKLEMKEAIQFHEKHPELAKTWGIIGPITDKKSALAMSLTYGKKAFTYNNKTYYLVPSEHHSKFKSAGFKQI